MSFFRIKLNCIFYIFAAFVFEKHTLFLIKIWIDHYFFKLAATASWSFLFAFCIFHPDSLSICCFLCFIVLFFLHASQFFLVQNQVIIKEFSDIIFEFKKVDLFLIVDQWRLIYKLLKTRSFFSFLDVKFFPPLAICTLLLLCRYRLLGEISLSPEMWGFVFVFQKLKEFPFDHVGKGFDKIFPLLLDIDTAVIDRVVVNGLVVGFELIEKGKIPFFKRWETVLVQLIFSHEIGVHFKQIVVFFNLIFMLAFELDQFLFRSQWHLAI